ncbi:hypothetical protein EG834_03345, partial [bacterium]|nr:hypothetical protein [bacterium]
MFRKHMMLVIGLLVVASMVLAACGGGDTTTDVPATDVVVTDVPVVPATTRVGGWADQLIFTSNPDSENAISQLSAGEIDVYAMSMSEPALYEAVRSDPNLAYSTSVGTYDAFHFNTIPFADGRWNPFVYVEIREAMHWLVDRNFLIQEYLGGLGLAKYTAFTVAFPDYARYIADIRAMEAKYAYNPDKANAAITAKMEELGSTKNADGKWLDPTTGEPVVIIGIIRVEDERQEFGIYLAGQLESVGFTVDQQLKTRTEASPIWRGDPTLGLWNYYTAGWINNYIARDEGSNFDFYYTTRGYPDLWQTMRTVDPTLDAISLRLATADYTTPEERDQLVSEILPMGTRDNSIMLLVDTQSFQAFNANIQTAYDLAANLAAGSQWAYTMRWKGQEGGTIRIAQGDLMIEPWNPLGGSNFVDDGMIQRATADSAFLWDPYTGLVWPNMAESFKLIADGSKPIFQSDVSLGWATFEKVDGEIPVPADAWYDWDPTTGKWITVGEAFPDGVTAVTEGIVTYPADLYTKVKWHDGTPFSAADVVMNIFMTFAQCKPESPIYDESIVSNCESWFSHFKGVRITSVDPLVIETYDDLFTTDAELNATSWWP